MRRTSQRGQRGSFLISVIAVIAGAFTAFVYADIEGDARAAVAACDIQAIEEVYNRPEATPELKALLAEGGLECLRQMVDKACEEGDGETLMGLTVTIDGSPFLTDQQKSDLLGSLKECVRSCIERDLPAGEEDRDLERLRWLYLLALYYRSAYPEEEIWDELFEKVGQAMVRVLRKLMDEAGSECDLERLMELFMWTARDDFPGEAQDELWPVIEGYFYDCVLKLMREAAENCDFEALEKAFSYALTDFFPQDKLTEAFELYQRLLVECVDRVFGDLRDDLDSPGWEERFWKLFRAAASDGMPEGDERWRAILDLYLEYLERLIEKADCDPDILTEVKARLNEILGEAGDIRREGAAEAVEEALKEARDKCRLAVEFVRGDANADGSVDLADAVWTLSYLFRNGDPAPCVKSSDTNDDGAIDIGDPILILSYLFADGASPAPPFAECGPDPTDDSLGCESFEPCAGSSQEPAAEAAGR